MGLVLPLLCLKSGLAALPPVIRAPQTLVLPVVLEQIVTGYAQPDEFDKLAQFDLETVILTASKCGRVDCIRDLSQYAHQFASAILLTSAEHGHVSILQYLRLYWGLTTADARAKDNYALRKAAGNGHVSVLQELRLHWGC